MSNKIYLAGGCFWGVEKFFSSISGVNKTEVGYANSLVKNPSYQDVCSGETNAVETLMIEYDKNIISLEDLLIQYLSIINPTSLNKQGGDSGTQYRTGIYYINDEDLEIISKIIEYESTKYSKPLKVEVEKLQNFYKAEEYHQKYLDKNSNGYCHIKIPKYKKQSKEELKKTLSEISYRVTQENATETPYTSDYNTNNKDGIYVDITTGEVLFSSKDKFDSGCGWPSFTKPIKDNAIKKRNDLSIGMKRTEIRSVIGDSHLGHVFNDGPKDKGGNRYCINGASLRFIPKNKLKEEGYGELEKIF